MISNRFASLALAIIFVCISLPANPALAASAKMEELERRLEEQQRLMEQQRRMLEQLQAEMRRMKQANERSAKQAEEAQKVAKQTAKRAEEQQTFAKDVQVDLFGVSLVTPTDTKEDPRFKLTASGQANRQVFYAMDSNRNKVYHTDSDNWPTLINVTAEAKVNDDVKVGAVIEAAFQDNQPLQVNQENEQAGFNFSSRFAENKEDGHSAGVFLLQDIDKWALQGYAGYRYYNVDRRALNLESIHVPVIGARKWF